MLFDYFVADLSCPRCGAYPEVEGRAGMVVMQAYVREEPDYSDLGIGDAISLRATGASGIYWTIRPPVANEPVRLLTYWYCPKACFPEVIWAQVTVVNEVITKIESLLLSRRVLREANFIHDYDMVVDLAASWTNRPEEELRALPTAEFMQVLMQALPE